MLSHLPAEILLQVFTLLPLKALAVCQRVSSAWLALIVAHSGCLYRNVLLLEGLVPAHQPAGRHEDNVADWRETCRRAKVLSLNWKHCRATCGWLVNPARDVWRLKIDEDAQTVIMTARGGGLSIVDLHTNQQVQRIEGVRPHAHLEFDQGFLVHDNPDGQSHTVYRRRSDIFQATDLQGELDPRAFVVWGILESPGAIRAYRFVYPHLLVGSLDMRSAWIWDVPSCTLSATIDIEPDSFGGISYVELTPSHFIVLGAQCMSVYRRPATTPIDPHAPHAGQCVLRFPSTLPSAILSMPITSSEPPDRRKPPQRMRRANVSFTSSGHEVVSFGLGLAASDGLETRVRVLEAETSGSPIQEIPVPRHVGFRAVHPCGKHLIIISALNRVYVILEYERVLEDPIRLEAAHTLAIDLREGPFNLCCSERGAVITTRKKVLFIARDDLPTVAELALYRNEGVPLSLTIHQLLDVTEIASEVISSVQLDSARLAFSYFVKADELDESLPGAPPFQAWRGGLTAVKVLDFGPTERVPLKAHALVEERLVRDKGGPVT